MAGSFADWLQINLLRSANASRLCTAAMLCLGRFWCSRPAWPPHCCAAIEVLGQLGKHRHFTSNPVVRVNALIASGSELPGRTLAPGICLR